MLLSTPQEILSTLDDEQIWTKVSSLLVPDTLREAEVVEFMLPLATAYYNLGSLSMVAKGDVSKATRELGFARQIAELLPVQKTGPMRNKIRLALAYLEIVQGHIGLALEASKSLEDDLLKDARAGPGDTVNSSPEFDLGAATRRIGDAYLEDMELGLADSNFRKADESFHKLIEQASKDKGQRVDLSSPLGRYLKRNSLIINERFGRLAIAGYDQASAVLAHESARAFVSELSSKPGRIATEASSGDNRSD